MSDYRIIKGDLRYKSAPLTDNFIDLNLDGIVKEQVVFDRNRILNLVEVFDRERQASTIIRPSFKLTFITENAYTGKTSYKQFKDNLYYTNNEFWLNDPTSIATGTWGGFPQYNEFDLIRTDYDVPGYTEPPNEHIQFVKKSATTYNWNFFVSYAFKNVSNRTLQYTPNYGTSPSPKQWIASDGIPYIITNITNLGENLISFKCPTKHNLNVSEYVKISPPVSPNIYGDIFQVYSLGDGSFGSEEYVFNIYNYGYNTNSFNDANEGTFKRIINLENSGETMSKYYVRQHKILTNLDNALLNYCGFENNAWNIIQRYDNSALTPDIQAKIVTKENSRTYTVNFNIDVDINPILDNQKRPITELYLTIVHKGQFGWFYRQDPLNTVNVVLKQGYSFNLPPDPSVLSSIDLPDLWWENNNTLNQVGIPLLNYGINPPKFYYNDSLKTGDTIDGDFCEWNDFEQKEYVLSDLYHKISFNQTVFDIRLPNLLGAAQTPNPNGYFYKPHHKIQIREFSPYIETGNQYEVDLVPGYAFYSRYTQSFRWRDLYTYGYIDNENVGVDYPFLNGVHNPYENVIFKLIPEGTNYLPNVINDPTIDDCE